VPRLILEIRVVIDDAQEYFPLVRRLVEEAIEARPPRHGHLGVRTALRHYTFSRSMWGRDPRGARIARRLGQLECAERWGRIARRRGT
jgi:hypothetical protein